MDVLVLYATVEGQTGKIADFAASEARSLGHSVRMVDVEELEPVSFEGVGAVILAAPVHQRRHPKNFEAFVEANATDLNGRRTLMLSISLSAAFPEGLEEANEYLVEMKMRTGLEPAAEVLVAGAVRVGRYDYFAMQVVRHVVLRGRDVDLSVGEHEFTDWTALAKVIDGFLGPA